MRPVQRMVRKPPGRQRAMYFPRGACVSCVRGISPTLSADFCPHNDISRAKSTSRVEYGRVWTPLISLYRHLNHKHIPRFAWALSADHVSARAPVMRKERCRHPRASNSADVGLLASADYNCKKKCAATQM